MENKKKSIVKAYFRWPFLLGGLLVLCAIGSFFSDARLGFLVTGVTIIYYLISLIVYFIYRRSILKKLVDFGSSYAQVQNQLLRQIEIPFAMCNQEGEIYWCNPAFTETFRLLKKQVFLSSLFPYLEHADFSKQKEFHVSFEDRRYLLVAELLDMHQAQLFEMDNLQESRFYNIYLQDETDLLTCRKELEEERSVIGLIYFDNYDEVMETVEYVRRSLLSALLERKLNQYISQVGGVVRKLEKDRYLVLLKQKGLWELEEDKFSLLEGIKSVNIGNEIRVTLSIGIGLGGESIENNYEYAQVAIDMALGRGGDQVVLKDHENVSYYGGKVQSAERNTRVKARVKANALRELIEAKSRVLIMGHQNSDLDCLGAAVGIYAAAAYSGRETHIIMKESPSIKPILNSFKSDDYANDLFVGPDDALSLLDKNTLVVVVDTNRPAYTECPELLERANQIVVMDHHRQGRDRIENAVLSYVEPNASSASEMVAEVVQYYQDGLKLRPREADAIYAGIVMDTNNFEDKAGVRTFEAAAYLKRSGADVARVRKYLRDSFADYQMRNTTLHQAQMFMDKYAIAVCPESNNPNVTVVAAQVANELLNIREVHASFVFAELDRKIYLSARSIDEINVQVLMEKLGGGGHLSIAGAQFQDISMNEAIQKLKDVLIDVEK